ncbi:mechanosensitive ion channel [uncultured Parasphingorhabdus sp.]|uniref:mechanosensitive ion channel n=1 Tax=uncultured Parasphingorhabdus sp. TaxID=2709694 RepID=UPI0030DDB297
MMIWGEKLGLALIILVGTWILGKAAKWTFAKLVDNVTFLQRDTSAGTSVGESLGKIVSLLIWLFGLLIILRVLGLGGVDAPIQTLLNSIMGFVPNLLGAAIIFFIGMVVARIVRDLVVTALQTVDFDKWANRGGIDAVTGNSTISKTIGTIIYVLIIIPIAILALEALNLESVSGPASDMLRMILEAIPNIIGAAIILGIGYLISKFVVQIITEILPGLGVDQSVAALDILPATTSLTAVLARIAQVAIMLFFAIAAMRLLGFAELTSILDQVLELGGRVIFGSIVIAVGFLIANLLSRIVGGTDEGSLASTIVRYATIILFTFMGLQFMGVGQEIVQTAFTALVIGGAAAAALAFGWGGRHVAGKLLENLYANPPKPKAPAAKKPAVRKAPVRKTVVKK